MLPGYYDSSLNIRLSNFQVYFCPQEARKMADRSDLPICNSFVPYFPIYALSVSLHACLYICISLQQLWAIALNPACPTFPSTSPCNEGPWARRAAARTQELQERTPVWGRGTEGEHTLTRCCWKRVGFSRTLNCLCIFISPRKYEEKMVTGSFTIEHPSSKEAMLLLEIHNGRKWKGSLQIN